MRLVECKCYACYTNGCQFGSHHYCFGFASINDILVKVLIVYFLKKAVATQLPEDLFL